MSTNSSSFGTVVRFHCNPGFYLVGSKSITCNSSGEWTFEKPFCQGIVLYVYVHMYCISLRHCTVAGISISCESLSRRIPSHGAISTNQTTNGTEVTFSCKEGYVVDGSANLVCLLGKWSDDPPSCRGLASLSSFRVNI